MQQQCANLLRSAHGHHHQDSPFGLCAKGVLLPLSRNQQASHDMARTAQHHGREEPALVEHLDPPAGAQDLDPDSVRAARRELAREPDRAPAVARGVQVDLGGEVAVHVDPRDAALGPVRPDERQRASSQRLRRDGASAGGSGGRRLPS